MKTITIFLTTMLLTATTLAAQDVYVSGIEYTNGGSVLVPTLWENGTQQPLVGGSSNTYAGSVYVSGSDVYVGGGESNGANEVDSLWAEGTDHALASSSGDSYAGSVSGADI